MASTPRTVPQDGGSSVVRAGIPWISIAWFGALLVACYAPVLARLVRNWIDDPDMGHAFFVPVIVGYIAWYWALARGGISRIAGTQFTQPLFGLVLAALVLRERPGQMTLLAALAILAGAWLVQHSART